MVRKIKQMFGENYSQIKLIDWQFFMEQRKFHMG